MRSVVIGTVFPSCNIVAESSFELKANEAVRGCVPEVRNHSERWGILLAGGDGARMRGLTRFISGDDRPKQFCAVVGDETLLQQAGRRASRSIAAHQTVVALMRSHARFYTRDLAGTDFKRLVQPRNRGTAPPIIMSLLHISQMNPAALVAILPSDQYYSDESKFTHSLEIAFKLAEKERSSAVLLGAKAEGPDIEFGWIEPGASVGDGLCQVMSFHEKPTPEIAQQLLERKALWSTFVIVGSVEVLIDIAFNSVPGLVVSFFDKVSRVPRTMPPISRLLYDSIPSIDFSRAVLSPNAGRLLALSLEPMTWHDLGRPDHAVAAARSRGKKLPAWVHAWEAAVFSVCAAGAI